MSESAQLTLKVVVIVHFVLTVWATMVFLGESYIYMNAFILAFGVWAIISPESVDAMFMFLILNVISVVLDIIFIAIFASMPGRESQVAVIFNTYRFSLGMAILNLILKPFTSYILFRLYQDRRGDVSFPTFGIIGKSRHGEYEPIGTGPSAPHRSNYVETAVPHSTIPPYRPTTAYVEPTVSQSTVEKNPPA